MLQHDDSLDGRHRMGKALGITRTDHTGATLRALAGKCRDGARVRRILALAMELDGISRSIAAASNGMDQYNDAGVDGLKTRLPPSREPFLTASQVAELYGLVVNGPDPSINHVVRGRCIDLLGELKRRFSVEVDEITLGKWLHKLGLTPLQPRACASEERPQGRNGF